MSYREIFTEAYNKTKQSVVKEEDKDHEISMARGELEAISDKALKLSSMLQGKSDEGNPLEAWVQSKITKAKDYINSVADYMEYNPDDAMEETHTDAETIEEKFMDGFAVRFLDPANKKRFAVAYKTKKDADDKAAQLKRDGLKDITITKHNLNFKETYTVVITKKDGTKMELGKYNTPAEAQKYVDMYGKGAEVKKEEFTTEAELELLEMNDYGLLGKITPNQIANIKKTWAKKTPADVTKGIKDMLDKMDVPSKVSIQMAGINVLSDLVRKDMEKK
jgi:hypothetical protein